MTFAALKKKLLQYRFELNHMMVFFVVLFLFQVMLAFFQNSLVTNFLNDAQRWFQKFHAERVAVVTSASLENLFENQQRMLSEGKAGDAQALYSVNVIFKQLVLQRSVEDISLILVKDGELYLIRDGQRLSDYLAGTLAPYQASAGDRGGPAVRYFASVREEMLRSERIMSEVADQKTFSVAVPFVPHGEYLGVLYVRITPDFTLLTDEVQANFHTVSVAFSALVFIGLIVMFVVSSGAVRDRDEAQQKLFMEHQANLEKQIRLEKESVFTKRIYHTHHKAEKIMGFIKSDVRMIRPDNIDEVKQRVIAYSNFISRIIYDMKWYDQDINTIVNPVFHANINGIIGFIVKHVFLRLSTRNEMFTFDLDLDPAVPPVHVNEFIIWEILEPLIQNCIDHGQKAFLRIGISTRYDPETRRITVRISDDGVGIPAELLQPDPRGFKLLFGEEKPGTRKAGVHSGYGCYIAYQMAVGKCDWTMDADNLEGGGACITMTIPNGGRE